MESLNGIKHILIMTQEEIKREADKYTDNVSNYAKWSDDGGWSETNDIKLIEKAFISGAKWADKTIMERVCNWLKLNEDDYYKYDAWKGDYVNFDALIEDLKKAMEK